MAPPLCVCVCVCVRACVCDWCACRAQMKERRIKAREEKLAAEKAARDEGAAAALVEVCARVCCCALVRARGGVRVAVCACALRSW